MKDPKTDRRRRYHSDADRIHLNVSIDAETQCWNWQNTIHSEGYGCFNVYVPKGKPRFWLAHRYSYLTFVGPIPEGLELDHLCRNRACVNPAHLEPVTKKVNARRGHRWATRPTHCQRDHLFDEANTGIGSTGHRFCRACARASARRYYARRVLRAAGIESAA